MSMDKCKVCGRDLNLSDSFCPQCGFEYHILPEPVSNKIRKYEEKRINACKTVWEKHSVEIKKLQKTYDEGVYKIETLEQELERARKETLSAQQEKEQDEEKLEEANKQISSLVHENQGLNENVKALRAEITKLKVILNTNKSNQSALKGIVIISDMTSLNFSDMSADTYTPINRQCLPVLSGINTYGSANSEEHHYQITIKHRGDVFLPKHFAVDTNHSKGLVIKDLSNGRITLNGNPFIEEYAGNSKFIIKQGRQIFTVEIKMFNL